MKTAEQAVRARVLSLLMADEVLSGRIHGVFDGNPPRATAPYIGIGAAESSDWGTKDRPGREVRLTVTLFGAGESRDDEAAAGVERVANALRGAIDGWTIAGARIVRTRFAFAREGGWRREVIIRCRCLSG